MDWEIVFNIVSLTGLVSLIWLISKDISKFKNRPRLKITEFEKERDLRIYHFPNAGFFRKFANLHVKNNGKTTAKRCVAILNFIEKPADIKYLEREYALHWADVDYSLKSTGAEPVDIGSEPRRLDVAFTPEDSKKGSWVAIPIALTAPKGALQAFLPPGEYLIEIKVSCENGGGDSKRFKIVSPNKWDELDFDII